MLKTIKVYGKLADFLGWKTYQADVASIAEVSRFLIVNWPGVAEHMNDQYYRISVGDYDLSADEFHHPVGQQEIKIMPVVQGADPFTAIVVGASFVGASAAGIIGTGAILGTTWAALATGVGTSLILGGVSQMLSPTPDIPTFDPNTINTLDPSTNYSFSGIQNVERSGTPLPLIFGECFVGSIVVSAGVDTTQIKGTL